MLRLGRESGMCKKSERPEPVVSADDDHTKWRERRAKRSHLAVALGITSAMKIHKHR